MQASFFPFLTHRTAATSSLEQRLSWWDVAFYFFFAVFTILACLTFRDYGYSWDEVWQNRWYGQSVLRFFSTFGKDVSSTTENNFYLYGGTFDVFAELLVALSALEPRNARHLANFLAGLLCLLGTWKTARHVGGPAAGFLSSLFLAVSAPFYGHIFINAKDIPFAAGYIWSLYFLLRIAPHLPNPPLKERLLLGLSLGLTLGVRIGGVLILLYYALVGILDLAAAYRQTERPPDFFPRVRTFAKSSIPMLGMGYFLMLAFWPAALLRPVGLPIEAFKAANQFDLGMYLLWNGKAVLSTDLPWSYLPVLFAVELPEVLVILLFAAVPWAFYTRFRAARIGKEFSGLGVLLMAALFPPLWAITNGTTLYDNMRHFIFVLPPLCCIAGSAFVAFSDFAAVRLGTVKWLPTVMLLLTLCYSGVQMASIHPYEYAYLNTFAGGMPEGAKKFETDYWITSYREAATFIEAHAKNVAALAGVPFSEAKFSVALVGTSGVGEGLLPEQFKTYRYGYCDRTDYLIASTRSGADGEWPEYPVLGTVGRRGMTFAVIKVSPELATFVENGRKSSLQSEGEDFGQGSTPDND